ncbi:MAG: 7-cyano-7-deazaguanine synthase QueC [Candidatus Omnitrophica bacterium]|nr:7-cyano-7-deazaguanine synthase QueC [Candidatus Omnitrophota bacterium]
MKKAIVLLSGGIDSTTSLYLAKKKGFEGFCLIFDYGQRHKREIESAKRIASLARCKYQVLKIDLPWKGSSLLDRRKDIPSSTHHTALKIPSTYVPARNIIFLSFALSWAETIGAEAIFIGAHAQDYSGYPDCRPEFYQAFRKIMTTGTRMGIEGRFIKILTPLIDRTKAQIIKLARQLRVPFELTWSCYRGGRFPCGRCPSCYFRAKGFKEAGIIDPLIKNRDRHHF